MLPSYSIGCRDQASAGNASTSARSRSASKRTGRRKNGFGSFNPRAALVACAEAPARGQPVGARLLVHAGDHPRKQRAVERVHAVLLLEQVVHERGDLPATVPRPVGDARVRDRVRLFFLDGRAHPPANAPHTKVGHSVGRWDGSTLVVDTTHLSASTITNNGLNHTDKVHLIERFWLANGGKTLMMLQEFEDPDALDNRGARFVGWDRGSDFIYPYECDPSFAANYQKK